MHATPASIALALCAPFAARQQPDGPNLLVFLVDQLNPHVVEPGANGFGGLDHPLAPNLARLADEGASFPRAYCATPQCVPARFALLTGRWPHSTGVRANKIWEVPTGEVTLAELARRAGYSTATIGKHHMAWLDQPEPRPTDHGYSEVLDMDDYERFCERSGVPPWDDRTRVDPLRGLPVEISPTGATINPNPLHPEGYFADRAIEYLEAHSDEPFALWCSFYGPHTPILPSGVRAKGDWARAFEARELDLPPNFDAPVTSASLERMRAAYARMSPELHKEVLARYYGLVAQIDFNVGRVLDALERLGLDDRTIVVFTSDHGGYASEFGAWKKGGGMYECLTRVPLVVRWPGVIPAGRLVPSLASHVDLAPTLCGLMGLSPPDEVRARWDGRSLVEDLLTGATPPGAGERAFVEFVNTEARTLRMVATPRDKVVVEELRDRSPEGLPTRRVQYFDLGADPWERQDLVGDPARAERVAELAAVLDGWWDGGAHAPGYLRAGSGDAIPAEASAPVPAGGTTGVARDVVVAWLPSTAAASQELFAGPSPDALELVAVLPPLAARADLGLLPAGREVFWRVDGVNANGRQRGRRWSFVTGESPAGPARARDPRPADGAGGVPPGATLEWVPAPGAARQVVRLGRAGGPLEVVLETDGETARWAPPEPLEPGATYAWRVDGESADGRAEGLAWTFVVRDLPPGGAGSPAPAHLARVARSEWSGTVSWSAAAVGDVTYTVSFGPTFPLPVLGTTRATTWTTEPPEPGRTYFWRVDERTADGSARRGRTWKFTLLP